MEFEIHPEAKKNFDKKARQILSKVTKVELPKRCKQNKKSNFFVTQTITDEDIIGDIKTHLEDGMGYEKGMLFIIDGIEYGIINNDYKEYLNLCIEIQKTPHLRDLINVNYIKTLLHDWIKDSFTNKTNSSFIDYVIKNGKDAIKKYVIWIPVPFTSIESDFSIGNIIFWTITEDIIEEWFDESLIEDKDPAQQNNVSKYKEKIQKDYQGYAVGVYECEAERGKAEELAYYHFKKSLSILRLLSGANLLPELVSGAYEYGRKMFRRKTYFLLEKDGIGFSHNDELIDNGLYFNIDKMTIDMMGKGELKRLSEILSVENPNEFQKKIIESLIIYSKHTIRYDLYDKILYILVGLESILIKNTTESIQQNLGDRMALLIGKTLHQRKDIAKNIKEIYSIRSNFIHHGQTAIDRLDLIKMFMYNSWITFSQIVNNMDNFDTKEEFINAIDNLKYS